MIQQNLIESGAIFYCSHSGGKDSQAMYALLRTLVPAEQLVVVHADLGQVEWNDVQEHITSNIDQELNVVRAIWKDGSEKTLLGMVEKRFQDRPTAPSWPSSAARFCTSDLKRDPIHKFIRNDMKSRGATVAVNCTGLRAEESSARAKKTAFERNNRLSLDSGARTVYEWLPIHDWSAEQVFRQIESAGQVPHQVYGEIVDYQATGNDRMSCVFCIMGSRKDIARGAAARPELLEQYADLEKRTGYTVFQGETIRERAGIIASDAIEEPALEPAPAPAPARPALVEPADIQAPATGVTAIDLFAGLGGWSTGAKLAGAQVAWAANHWRTAVDYHSANHPEVSHVCQDLHQADWSQVPDHNLLMASPCCHGHSRARGKDRPQHDASRSTAWAVVSATEYHRPEVVLVENVPEFQEWALYVPWKLAMEALGYTVSPQVVDCADLGVPQHRTRLVVICTRSQAPLRLQLPKLPHITARDIIDHTAGSWSLVRKPGRSPKTLARVERGRQQHGDQFVMPYYGSGSGLTGRSLDRPLGTITTRARWALVDGDRMRMLTVPETRRAMGFPVTTHLPKAAHAAIHLLGNAFPPPAAARMIQAVQKAA